VSGLDSPVFVLVHGQRAMQAKLQPTTMAHPDLAPGPGVYKEEPAPVAGDPVSTAFPTNYCPVAACVLFVLCFALLCFALLCYA